jgi:hypothetical protein
MEKIKASRMRGFFIMIRYRSFYKNGFEHVTKDRYFFFTIPVGKEFNISVRVCFCDKQF